MESNNEWTKIIPSTYVVKRLEEMRFTIPTPIQSAVIPQAIQHIKDVIGAAETGSGKTLAFAIPLFVRWLDERQIDLPKDQVKLFGLIITPTRELAIQIRDVFNQLSVNTEQKALNTVAIVGGMSIQKQQRLLRSRPDIIVGTPGRLWALKEAGEEHIVGLSNLRVIVVDEIDRMLKEGHFQELRRIIKHIHSIF
jgi:ATP-dependent RNA helicase DDX24/MAK5